MALLMRTIEDDEDVPVMEDSDFEEEQVNSFYHPELKFLLHRLIKRRGSWYTNYSLLGSPLTRERVLVRLSGTLTRL